MPAPITIFLVGTRRDLPGYYEAARDAIGRAVPDVQVEMMEELVAEDIWTDRWSRREARSHEVLVGLVGRFRGTVRGGKSFVEHELETAKEANVTRLMFLTDQGDEALVSSQSAEERAAQEAFRLSIAESVTPSPVQSPQEFAARVVDALQTWQRRTFNGWLIPSRAFIRQFELQQAGSVASRDVKYVGGEDRTGALEAFANSDALVMLVTAGWGFGKSRLLLEWADRTRHPVAFLREDAELTDPGDRVRLDDPMVIAVDDAHRRRQALRQLIPCLQQRAPRTKLILATRPHGADGLRALLAERRFSAEQIRSLDLARLSTADHRQLVRSIVGRNEQLVAAIARRTRDSPLAAVVLSTQVARGKLDPADIEGRAFKLHVFDQYIDSLKSEVPQATTTLDLIALVGPIRPRDEAAMEALADALPIPRHELEQHINQLERSHHLTRRGGLLRVPVDAIAENLIARTAIASDGRSTGYIEHVLHRLPQFVLNALTNMGGVDSAARSGEPGPIAAAASRVWELLPACYEGATADLQDKILQGIENIAAVYPEAALAFVRREIDRVPNSTIIDLPDETRLRHARLRLLRAARNATLNARSVAGVCDILWRFASLTEPAERPLQELAEKGLKGLGEYDSHRDVAVQAAFVAWAKQQWKGRTVPGRKLGAYLRDLFSREFRNNWSDGTTMSFDTGRLPYHWVEGFRAEAIELLQRIGLEGDLSDARAALDALANAIAPFPLFPRPSEPAREAEWRPEEDKALAAMHSIIEGRASPALSLALPGQVHRIAGRRPGSLLTDGAQRLVALAARISDGTLEASIVHAHDRQVDLATWQDQQQLRNEAAARALAGESPASGLTQACAAHESLLAAGLQSSIGYLFYCLGRQAPPVAIRWYDLLLDERGHPLRPSAFELLRGVAFTQPAQARASAQRWLVDGPVGLMIYDFDANLFGLDFLQQALRAQLQSPVSAIRGSALDTLSSGKPIRGVNAWALLRDAPVIRDSEEFDGWIGAILQSGSWEVLRIDEKVDLCRQLVPPPELGYWSVELLKRLATEAPEPVLGVFQARVLHSAARPACEALSTFDVTALLSAIPSIHIQQAMQDALPALGSEHSIVQWHARRWFALLETADPSSAKALRRRLLEAGTLEGLEAVLSTFDRITPEQFLRAEEEILMALDLSRQIDTSNSLAAEERLVAAVSPFGWNRERTLGEPDPDHVALMERATEAAARHSANPAAHHFFNTCVKAISRRIALSLERDAELEFR